MKNLFFILFFYGIAVFAQDSPKSNLFMHGSDIREITQSAQNKNTGQSIQNKTTEQFAKNTLKEVSLVVSAEGATKTEAVNNALMLAIEQTYGTFVSANTEILNDQLVKEEIATVTSGNIQKFTEVAAVTLPNGNTSVTLNVTVSLAKLVAYAQSKGSECEFAGATFGANLRLYELNKKNERSAIQNMIKQLDALRPAYDYDLVVSDPVMDGDSMATVKMDITAIENERTKTFNDIIKNTFMALAMTREQIKPLLDAGFSFRKYQLFIKDNGEIKTNDFYWFYNPIPKEIGYYVLDAMFDFSIYDNNRNNYTVDIVVEDYAESPNCFGHVIGAPAPLVWGDGYCTIPEHQYFNRTDRENIMMLFCNRKIQGYLNKISFDIPVDYVTKIRKITIVPTKKSLNKVLLSWQGYENERPELCPYLLHSIYSNSRWNWDPENVHLHPAHIISAFFPFCEIEGDYYSQGFDWLRIDGKVSINYSKHWTAYIFCDELETYLTFSGIINDQNELIIKEFIESGDNTGYEVYEHHEAYNEVFGFYVNGEIHTSNLIANGKLVFKKE